MSMGHAVRSRTGLCGYAACVCAGCAPRGGKGKGAVKRLTHRAIRRGERAEVAEALDV